METLGNTSLLDRKKIGYFASGTIASLSVLPTLDWAAVVARREDKTMKKMDREEFMQKAYQLMLEEDGKEWADSLMRAMKKVYKDQPIIKGETPEEVVDFWRM